MYRFGVDAYDLWMEALQAQRAGRFGCGYNAACYAEGRRFAWQFLERMSTRRPLAAALLKQSSAGFQKAANAMDRVSEIFPFSHEEQGRITDVARIKQAISHLAQARDAEAEAMGHLVAITRMQVRKPSTTSP